MRALLLAAGCAAALAQTPSPDAAFLQGSEAYRAGDCPEAIRQLTQSKGTPRALFMMGRCYLDAGDFTKAQSTLEEYRKSAAGDEEPAILLARAEEGAGHVAQAVALLEELHKQSPGSLAVADALANAYSKADKPGLAVPLYNNVLKAQPADIGALAGLARLAAASSQWAASAEQDQKVLDLSPDNFEANEAMGQAQLQLGNLAAATPYLQHAWRLRPDDWPLAKRLADVYLKTSKWPELVSSLEYDSLQHPDDEEVTGWMVQAFGHTGDQAHAERYYRAVLQHTPANFTARMTLASLLDAGKRFKEAEEQYVLVLKARPDLFQISDRAGQIAEQESNLAEAIRFYESACRSPQATVDMRLRLARLYFRTGGMDQARPVLEALLQAQPENREVKVMLTEVAMKTGRNDDAARYAADLLPGDPKNLMLLRLLGEDALKHNNDAAASDYLERAYALNEKDRDLRFELVTLYTNDDSLDKLSRAFDLMNEYVGLYPEDYEGYLLLANLYRRKTDSADALDYFTRGFNRMPAKPPARMSWAYNSMGLLLLSLGKYEEALANQLKAVDLNPADSTAVYNLALTYLKLKRKDEVNAAREKLSQMGPPELVALLDEQIQKSRINDRKK